MLSGGWCNIILTIEESPLTDDKKAGKAKSWTLLTPSPPQRTGSDDSNHCLWLSFEFVNVYKVDFMQLSISSTESMWFQTGDVLSKNTSFRIDKQFLNR